MSSVSVFLDGLRPRVFFPLLNPGCWPSCATTPRTNLASIHVFLVPAMQRAGSQYLDEESGAVWKMWRQTIFKAPTSDWNYQENRDNLRQRQTACSITKLTYNFSFCSKATATFSTMEQATEQLQNERQATQDAPLEPHLCASDLLCYRYPVLSASGLPGKCTH